MTDRYSRQELFRHIGKSGQKKISEKHVFILGCGALGSANADSLVRAGVGKLTIVDRDYVELSNLQRQQLYTEADVLEQMPKAIAAKQRLELVNSGVEIDAHVMEATSVSIEPLVKDADLVIDATDNFDVRLMMNDLLQKFEIPWVFGSIVGSTGMSYTILPKDTPCLSCLLDVTSVSGATCDSVGVISPAVQMVAAHQTTEALKLLVEAYSALRTQLVTFDLWNNHFQMIHVDRAKKESCPTCGVRPTYPYLNNEALTKTEALCGRDTVQIRTKQKFELDILAKRLEKLGKTHVNEFLLSIEYQTYRVVFFQDGRALIHGTNSIDEAKRVYYQLAG